jgi:hypothetical protein
MSVTNRQNNLFLAEDWSKIYQTFTNADFTSYDFENIRRVMITYLRENFPESFNDYIESSEYLALIDLIAFFGQSLAYRLDFNARENFLELAERRESILRLANMISYNPSRTISASGFLKLQSVVTTENIIDSNGNGLGNVQVSWNDASNINWFDQFTKIMNASFIENVVFGSPLANANVNGLYTEQYKINSYITDIPIFPFSATVNGNGYNFEAVSTVINYNASSQTSVVAEDVPLKGNQVSLIYTDDGQGYGSNNTGFFIHFKQGTLAQNTFNINNPVSNQIINVAATNINNDDVWMYQLDKNGVEQSANLWTQVPAINGNNIIYNSIDKTKKNIYFVQTTANDSISLNFADGVFGNLPKGTFRIYYRTSNGLSYAIHPGDMSSIIVNVPYLSKTNTLETLKLIFSLESSVTNASGTETNVQIKQNAPATYYTQNRMITGEDYNLAPLNVSQSIAKVKAINRTSSGISRNFDLVDASGTYSRTSIFCQDGILYKEKILNSFKFTFNSTTDIQEIILNKIQPLASLPSMRDFYYSEYNKIKLDELNAVFTQITSGYNQSNGYIANSSDRSPLAVIYTGTALKFVQPGAMIKFVPPTGKYFTDRGTLTSTPSVNTTDRIWANVVSVSGDGTGINNNGRISSSANSLGTITLGRTIPDGAILDQIIPFFLNHLSTDLQSVMNNLIFNYRFFGLRYDQSLGSWTIIQDRNLNLKNSWGAGYAGDNSGQKLDSSWLIAFETDGTTYTVSYRGLEYFFESVIENRFYFDGTRKVYDTATGSLQKDKITVLKINTLPGSNVPMVADYPWQIVGSVIETSGYASTKVVKVSFYDDNDDGLPDNPDAFDTIVKPSSVGNEVTNSILVFFEKYITDNYTEDYRYIANDTDPTTQLDKFLIFATESQVTNLSQYPDGQLFYFYIPDIIKIYNKSTGKITVTTDYYANVGRTGLYFYYLHNADSTTRIDPSSTNIMDIYLLTRDYDIQFRNWLIGNTSTKPLPPTSTNLLTTYGTALDAIKSISDEIVYHPVEYKVLFGAKADSRLQAQFLVIKNTEQVITDNTVKAKIIQTINQFFALGNFDFGDTFYFTELSSYVMNQLTPYITTFVIVPTASDQVYGSLQELVSTPNEIFISGATVDNITIVESITASNLKSAGYVLTTSNFDVNSTNLKSG